MTQTVLITDFAWPDVSLEREIIEAAGYTLMTGPSKPASSEVIAELVEQHQPAGIMTCWAPVSEQAIASSKALRIVARLGVGLDNIAVDEATQRGIWVTNVPDYCVEEVSDHALGMVLSWARGLLHFDREVKAGRWNPASAKLRRVSTLTIGILGFGQIGRRTAEKLRGFGVKVLGHSRHAQTLEPLAQAVSLEELFQRSDGVIVHAPLTSDSYHLVNRERLALMKPGAFLVNVSRGAVVDTPALIEALESGHLSGAALDVLEGEPQVPPALLNQPNVLITPHVAFSSDASLVELRRSASEEVVRVLRGEKPRQPKNAPRGLRGFA
jgi:D-3-phosphoglycerate dehydrogenase